MYSKCQLGWKVQLAESLANMQVAYWNSAIIKLYLIYWGLNTCIGTETNKIYKICSVYEIYGISVIHEICDFKTLASVTHNCLWLKRFVEIRSSQNNKLNTNRKRLFIQLEYYLKLCGTCSNEEMYSRLEEIDILLDNCVWPVTSV